MKKITITITDSETIELLEKAQDKLTLQRIQTGLLTKQRKTSKIPLTQVLKSILKDEK